MTDILVVGLLLVIIFILISVYAPEVLIYGLVAFCCIGLIICIVVLGAQFIHDPIGFLYGLLITNNPIVAFGNNMTDSTMSVINQTIKP
jgi:hypothetical protein